MKQFFTLLALFAVTITQAQWVIDTEINTLVADAEVDDMQAIGTSNGMTYVVFWEPVGAPLNYELRLQILDADGNKTLGANGMLVSDAIPMSTYTSIWKITVDDDDNLYIGCTGTGGGDPAFIFKLDTDGNNIWSSSGIEVGTGNLVTVLPLSTGETLVSWLGSAGGVMQKLDSDGNLIWPSEMPIESGSSITAPANLFEISGDNYIVVFHTLLSGINSYLYAQRYDSNGVAQWANPTQLADRTTAYNRQYVGLNDEDVVYMGYFASAGVRFDSYLQRLNPDGTLPWGINGADFDVNETNYELETDIAFQSGTDYIYSVCRYTDNTQSQIGEYVQKFDKNTGARLLTETAKQVFALGSNKHHSGKLHLLEGTPFYLIEDGMNNGASPITLNAVYLDDQGDFVWTEETKPVATFSASKARVQYTAPVNGQSVAVFTENKGDGSKIYAQNFVEEVLGLNENSLKNETISYNNPVSATLRVVATSEIKNLSMYNMMGQKVMDSPFQATKVEVNIANLSSGIYLMNIETESGLAKGLKIVKK